MKKNKFLFKLVFISLTLNLTTPLFSEDQIQNQKNEEIPQVFQDIRRFEIITLGSLPFVILDANLVYSGIQYFQNDMSKNYFPSFSPTLTKEEQKNILFTSMGISLSIGLTDLIINLVKRNKKNKKIELDDTPINIVPISENPNAIKLPTLEEMNEKKELQNNNIDNQDESEIIKITEDDN